MKSWRREATSRFRGRLPIDFYMGSSVEDTVLQTWSNYLLSKQPTHLSLHFDGVRINADLVEDVEALLSACQEKIKEATGFNVQIRQKIYQHFLESLACHDVTDLNDVPAELQKSPNCVPCALWHLAAAGDKANLLQAFLQIDTQQNAYAAERSYTAHISNALRYVTPLIWNQVRAWLGIGGQVSAAHRKQRLPSLRFCRDLQRSRFFDGGGQRWLKAVQARSFQSLWPCSKLHRFLHHGILFCKPEGRRRNKELLVRTSSRLVSTSGFERLQHPVPPTNFHWQQILQPKVVCETFHSCLHVVSRVRREAHLTVRRLMLQLYSTPGKSTGSMGRSLQLSPPCRKPTGSQNCPKQEICW